jgi:hypothetical protein
MQVSLFPIVRRYQKLKGLIGAGRTCDVESYMLMTSVRNRLSRNDAQLAFHVLVRQRPNERVSLEQAFAERGIDALLDHPALGDALISDPHGAFASLPLMTYVLVRRSLRAAGEHDRYIADFVSGIVFQFGLRDRARRIREHDDVEYDTLASLLADADSADAQRAFLTRAHLGNLALWTAGLFPDRIEAMYHRRGGPRLEYYDEMGSRGYLLASRHRLANEHGVVEFFETVSERFPRLRVALNHLSDTSLFPRFNSADKLMRQVRNAM